jgi:hypothetical protein
MTSNVAVETILEIIADAVSGTARQIRFNPEATSREKSIDFVAAIPATLPSHFYDKDVSVPMGLTETTLESFGSRIPHFLREMLGDQGMADILSAVSNAKDTEPRYLYSASTLYACRKDLVIMVCEAVTQAGTPS